jgi:hypothetical protein
VLPPSLFLTLLNLPNRSLLLLLFSCDPPFINNLIKRL